MVKPESGPTYAGLSLANGDYTVIELSAVVSNDTEVDSEALERLDDLAAEAEYEALLKLMTSEAEVILTPPEELEY